MKVRYPAVAGQFYESDPEALRASVKDCFLHKLGPGMEPPTKKAASDIYGFVTPHAGYVYSGPVAAHSYYHCSALEGIDLVVILGPNHYGIGSGLALPSSESWQTPLGMLQIDDEARDRLAEDSGIVDIDDMAHLKEHSIEVQLPFLQSIFDHELKILPLAMLLQDTATATEIGHSISNLVRDARALLLASSDLTHYEEHSRASSKDRELIDMITRLDVPGFYSTLQNRNISACGYGAIAAVMTAARDLGATEGRLLKYATSGDVTGDLSSVVGYPSIMFV